MKSESEIIELPLEDRQKLWVELKLVTTGSRDYPTAKALIEVIEATDDWETPEQVEVVAKTDCQVDGKKLAKNDTGKVYSWQFKALGRFLSSTAEVAKKAAKAAEKKAALIIVAILLGLAGSASAQSLLPTILYQGTPGNYQVYALASLTGAVTNSATVLSNTTNTYSTNVVTSYVTNTIPNWNIVNGTPTNSPTTVITTNASIPGLLFLGNWDQAQLHLGYNAGQGSGTNVTFSFNTSADLVNWKTNDLVYALLQNGNSYVQTNIYFTIGTVPRYLVLNTISVPTGILYASNLVAEVSVAPKRTGP